MTYKEFLARLRKTPRRWKLVGGKKIRCENRCPLEVAYGLKAGQYDMAEVTDRNYLDVESIALAADQRDYLTSSEATVRRDLLRACGLKEKA